MKKLFILFIFLFSACATAVEREDRKVQVVVANLKFKKIESVQDLKGAHKAYQMALPYLGSKGNQQVNEETIKLYARGLKFHDVAEHIETIWPAIKKDRGFFKELIEKLIEDKKIKEKFLEHIKDYAEFEKSGNG